MHLSDCFLKTMSYINCLLKSMDTKQPAYDEVEANIRELLKDSEAIAIRGSFSFDEYEQARFAICAWIDEAILNSAWNQKKIWAQNQLQQLHYDTPNAGEEFFDRLDVIELHQKGVREVYYLCLALGFAGRYYRKHDQYKLEQIKASNLKLLLGSSTELPPLECHDNPPESYPYYTTRKGKRKIQWGSYQFTALCLGAPTLLLCVLLYLIY